MLVLSRKEGQKIRVGDDICITIVRVSASVVRIGVEAPEDVVIVREELIPPGQAGKNGATASPFDAEDAADQSCFS